MIVWRKDLDWSDDKIELTKEKKLKFGKSLILANASIVILHNSMARVSGVVFDGVFVPPLRCWLDHKAIFHIQLT
jgi:hypothetical protein